MKNYNLSAFAIASLCLFVSINSCKPKNAGNAVGGDAAAKTYIAPGKYDELSEMNNNVTKTFFIYEDELKPVYPYNFSIVNKSKLAAKYNRSIDTESAYEILNELFADGCSRTCDSSASYQLSLKFSRASTWPNCETGRGFAAFTGPLGGRLRSVKPVWRVAAE